MPRLFKYESLPTVPRQEQVLRQGTSRRAGNREMTKIEGVGVNRLAAGGCQAIEKTPFR